MNQKQQMNTRGKGLRLQLRDLSTCDASVFLVVSIKQIWSPNKLVLKMILNMLSKWGKHKHLLVEFSCWLK